MNTSPIFFICMLLPFSFVALYFKDQAAAVSALVGVIVCLFWYEWKDSNRE